MMGKITIKALQCGTFGLDRDALLAGAQLNVYNKNKQREWYNCPSFTYVIDHPDGKMLFDASIWRGWQEEWPQEWIDTTDYTNASDEEYFEARLKQLKLEPSDFKYVFLSHLHSDHAGNARLFAGTDAKILVHEKELTGVAQLEADGKNAHNFFLSSDYSVSGLKYTTLYGDQEIMKGIRAISLPGHTWGTMGLMIELEHSGTIILSGDSLYLADSYHTGNGAMIDNNRDEWRQSLNKIKLLQKAYDAMIIPGHDHNVIHHKCSCHPLREESKLRLWPDSLYD
jgi:N-acyl homoserine lactone hydrolase